MRYWWWGAVLLLGVPVYFGLINLGGTHVNRADKPAIAESHSCPGYRIIRQFKDAGTIDSFRPVKPAANWDCDYIVNDGVGDLRFRREGARGVGLSFLAGGSTTTKEAEDLNSSLESEAQKLGFASR